jgi:hypothetical protein
MSPFGNRCPRKRQEAHIGQSKVPRSSNPPGEFPVTDSELGWRSKGLGAPEKGREHMKYRAALKRPLLALGASIAVLVAGMMPGAWAVEVNNLSQPGTTGDIRVRPITFGNNPNGYHYNIGDGSPKQNPNRTVGDVPVVAANACTSVAPGQDCFRVLGVNGPFQPAWDGHTHYHPGQTKVVVNERKFFQKGDTILIGSQYCNHAFLGYTCKRVVDGVLFDEQPVGEVNYIVAGVGTGIVGPGVIDLAFPMLAHAKDINGIDIAFTEGTQVTKLPTVYPGQLLRVEVSGEDLRNGFDFTQDNFGPGDSCSTTEIPPVPGCGDGIPDYFGVDVTAEMIPPGCDPGDEDCRRLLSHKGNPQTVQDFHQFVVPADSSIHGWTVPQAVSGVGTIGRSYDSNTPDTWYTVEVIAHLVDQGGFIREQIVSDGLLRWKPNSIDFDILDCANDGIGGADDDDLCARPKTQIPGGRVDIRGRVVDNSNFAARDRRVENVIVRTVVTDPDGGRTVLRSNTCFDTDGDASNTQDNCSSRFPTKPKSENHHGEFQATVGAGQCINPALFDFDLNQLFTMCSNPLSAIGEDLGHLFETFTTGTYTAEATYENVSPNDLADTTFDIVLI